MGILLEFSTNFLMGLHQFYTTAKEFTTNPSEVSALLMNRVLNHTSFDAVFGLIGTSKTIHNAFSFLSNSTNQVQDSTIVESINYSSQAQNPYLVADSLLFTNEESSSNFRYQKFQNPVFKADYKSGNYFTKVDLERFPHMINTFIELTGGIRKPS